MNQKNLISSLISRAFLIGCLGSALLVMPSSGQVTEPPEDIQGNSVSFGLDTEVGVLKFENADGDGERYLSSVLAPTISKDIWSLGLRLRYRWNQQGMRDEDYDQARDYLAILRFVQMREKGDSAWYGRIGDIDRAEVGFGQFVNRYRNTPSLDEPTTGLILDYRTDGLQVEGMFSNIASPEVYALRGAMQPLSADSSSWWAPLWVGVSLAGDLSEEGRLESADGSGLPFFRQAPEVDLDSLGLTLEEKKAPLTMIGVDANYPLQSDRFEKLEVFSEWGAILGKGMGISVGSRAEWQRGPWRLKGWTEQRVLGPNYVPSYFNSRYEIDRFRTASVTLEDGTSIDAVNTKRNRLYENDGINLGGYMGMEIRYKRIYRVRWSLENSYTQKGRGWFELDVRVTDPELPFQVRWVFDRVNMDSLNDIIAGKSEDALIRLELAYKLKNFLLVGFRYRQSFDTIESLGRRIGRKKTSRIEPAIILRLAG